MPECLPHVHLVISDLVRAVSLGGPLEILELLTPVMAVTMILLSVIWESLWAVLPSSPYFASFSHTMISLAIIAVGAIIAFLMVWGVCVLV